MSDFSGGIFPFPPDRFPQSRRIRNGVIDNIQRSGPNYFVTISYRKQGDFNRTFTENLVLIVSQTTIIISLTGQRGGPGNLRVGMRVDVTFSARMTMSLPPQAVAYLIIYNPNVIPVPPWPIPGPGPRPPFPPGPGPRPNPPGPRPNPPGPRPNPPGPGPRPNPPGPGPRPNPPGPGPRPNPPGPGPRPNPPGPGPRPNPPGPRPNPPGPGPRPNPPGPRPNPPGPRPNPPGPGPRPNPPGPGPRPNPPGPGPRPNPPGPGPRPRRPFPLEPGPVILPHNVTTSQIIWTAPQNSFLLAGQSDNAQSQRRFNVLSNTQILDQHGRSIRLQDLPYGVTVRIEHDAFLPGSTPPQANAIKIEIV